MRLALIIFLSVGQFFLVCAQDLSDTKSPHKYKTVFKTNPLSMIAGVIPFTSEYRLLGEYAVNKNQAAQLGFSYLGKSPILSAIESSGPAVNNVLNQKLKVRGYRIQASYKFYLTQLSNGYNKSEFLAPQGLYFAPLVSYSSAKMYMRYFQVNDIWIRATHFNANLLIGGQAFLGNLALDVFFGFGLQEKPMARTIYCVSNNPGGYE